MQGPSSRGYTGLPHDIRTARNCRTDLAEVYRAKRRSLERGGLCGVSGGPAGESLHAGVAPAQPGASLRRRLTSSSSAAGPPDTRSDDSRDEVTGERAMGYLALADGILYSLRHHTRR